MARTKPVPAPSKKTKRSTAIKWLRRFGFVLVGLALCWFVLAPRVRPPLRSEQVYGVDVSHHQGRIDWDSVARDNITFAYIKATEGGDYTDPRFGTNWNEAGGAGLERGAYHFFTACTDGAAQAAHFLAVAPPDPTALAPAIDLETSGNCVNYPDPAVVAAQLDKFLEIVEAAWGRKPVIYILDNWEEVFPTRDRLAHPLWLRSYLPLRGDWAYWQLPPFTSVDGIEGRVDLNVRAAPTG